MVMQRLDPQILSLHCPAAGGEIHLPFDVGS
jgi:hypothetical protein